MQSVCISNNESQHISCIFHKLTEQILEHFKFGNNKTHLLTIPIFLKQNS